MKYLPYFLMPKRRLIAVRIIKKLPHNVVIQIASSVWKTGSRDIRDVLKIAKYVMLQIQKKT